MHRAGESIGTIAAALAKAQVELTNPEKSLVGTIPGMTPKGDRSFRYASLSTGLDLVRKSLGRHERRCRRPQSMSRLGSSGLRQYWRTRLELVAWAGRILPIKNSLRSEDALAIEQAFATRMAAFETEPPDTTGHPASVQSEPTGVIEPELQLPKTRQVASKPCVVCDRTPSDAHHLRFAEPRALGRKVSDEFTVPLCRIHYRQVHDRGDEASWWTELKIGPLPIADALWAATR